MSAAEDRMNELWDAERNPHLKDLQMRLTNTLPGDVENSLVTLIIGEVSRKFSRLELLVNRDAMFEWAVEVLEKMGAK